MSNTRTAVADASAPETAASPLHDLKLQRLVQAIRGYSPEQLLWSSGYLAGLAAARCAPAQVVTLLISDVPGDCLLYTSDAADE